MFKSSIAEGIKYLTWDARQQIQRVTVEFPISTPAVETTHERAR